MVMINGKEVDARELLARQHKHYGKRILRDAAVMGVYRESWHTSYGTNRKKLKKMQEARAKDLTKGFNPDVEFC